MAGKPLCAKFRRPLDPASSLSLSRGPEVEWILSCFFADYWQIRSPEVKVSVSKPRRDTTLDCSTAFPALDCSNLGRPRVDSRLTHRSILGRPQNDPPWFDPRSILGRINPWSTLSTPGRSQVDSGSTPSRPWVDLSPGSTFVDSR